VKTPFPPFDGGVSSGLLEPAGYCPPKHYLAPGRLYASADRVCVTTILGSCVAVCLYDPDHHVGGINHFLLPFGLPPSPRFGDAAVPLLIESVLAQGAHRPTLRAKLFGGACVLEAFRSEDPLGAQNVRVARARLQAEHIPIVAEDTGGDHGRKLLFEPQTGDAWVRAIETRQP
jgi:chemotaxis protein CheD